MTLSVQAEKTIILFTKNISAVHAALYRLEDKGMLSSSFGGVSPKRGGKKKRLFQVTSGGLETLRHAKTLRESFWSSIPQLSFEVISRLTTIAGKASHLSLRF